MFTVHWTLSFHLSMTSWGTPAGKRGVIWMLGTSEQWLIYFAVYTKQQCVAWLRYSSCIYRNAQSIFSLKGSMAPCSQALTKIRRFGVTRVRFGVTRVRFESYVIDTCHSHCQFWNCLELTKTLSMSCLFLIMLNCLELALYCSNCNYNKTPWTLENGTPVYFPLI